MNEIHAGVIGLGAMGAPMARHLAEAGLLVTLWNRTQATAEALGDELELPVAASPEDLARQCNVIVTCVSADADLLEVVDAMAPGLAKGDVVVDTSTVSPATAREASRRVAAHGATFADAPVSGGVEGARRGTLSVMVGADSATFERSGPVLDTFSARVTHMGPVGSGQATKAVNQVMVAGIAEAVCEALAFSEQLNLPSERLLKVLGAGAAGSWFLEHRGQSMLDDRFDVGFKLALLLKDLGICRELARDVNISLPMVETAIADYHELVERGEGDHDISALIHLRRPN